MRTIAGTVLAFSFCIYAQTPLAFEAASIKPAPPDRGSVMYYRTPPGGRVSISNATLKLLIQNVYRVREFQISDGPGWISTQGWDIEATPGAAISIDQRTQMLQALLAERFKLRAHNETKILPGFALLVGKGGPKMKIAEGERDLRRSAGGQGFRIKGKGTMAQLAEIITDCLDRPVIDMTGLAGMFEVDLNWSQEEGPGMPLSVTPGQREASVAPSGPSIFTVLQELGLELEPRKTPADFLVIDHIEPIPTEN